MRRPSRSPSLRRSRLRAATTPDRWAASRRHSSPQRRAKPAAPENSERKRLIDAFGGEYNSPARRKLSQRRARQARARERAPTEIYRVTLLDSPIVNAFALPSGDIFVTRGLLGLANDGAEVAAVMAHEIAHITAQHASQRAELERTAALFSRVSQQVLDKPQRARSRPRG